MEENVMTSAANEDLSGKVVVVTGASSGFGRGMAIEFARNGCSVVLAARRDDVLEEVMKQCEEVGPTAMVIATDVSNRYDVEKLASDTVAAFGRIDVWVNNAGVGALGRFEDVPLEVHAKVVETDLLGTLYGSHCAYKEMIRQKRGVLINVASELGQHTVPYFTSYAAAKHGVVGMTQALRQELSLRELPDVHVCLVFPTAHDTPFFDHAANYTGHEVQAPPPLHDPQNVVDVVIGLARNPKDEKIVGGDGVAKVLMKKLVPVVEEKLAAKQMHKTQIDKSPPAGDTPGAVLNPTDRGQEVDVGRRDRR
jgi:short-subunit dehydrogenase